MGTFYSESDIRSRLVNGIATVVLTNADRAWNPASTTNPMIWGAAIVNYTLHADGGWDTTVRRGVK